MRQRASGTFDLTSWDVQASDEQDGATFGRVLGTKTFRGGIDGGSSVELLTAMAEGSAAYVAIERVTAAVDGRAGRFVLQHVATAVGDSGGSMRVSVVPGLGAGELAGLRGEMQIDQHPDGEHTYTFDYDYDYDFG